MWLVTNIRCQSVTCLPLGARHEPLHRYSELRFAHAPGMPGTFSAPPRVSDPGMHHGTCVTHVPWCIPGSLTSGFLWRRWWGKRSRHSRRMRNPQVYVSGKRPMVTSWNAATFPVTGPLRGESTAHLWTPLTEDHWWGAAAVFHFLLVWTSYWVAGYSTHWGRVT